MHFLAPLFHYVALFSTYPICSYQAYPFPLSPLILDFFEFLFFFFFNSGSQVWAGSLIEQKGQGETNTTHFIFMSFLLWGSEGPQQLFSLTE